MNTSTYRESDAPQPTPWGEKLLCSRLSKILLYVSLNMAVHLYPSSHPLLYNVIILYNKLISVSKRFSEFCELFQQIIKSMEGACFNANCRTSSRCCQELLDQEGGKPSGVRSAKCGRGVRGKERQEPEIQRQWLTRDRREDEETQREGRVKTTEGAGAVSTSQGICQEWLAAPWSWGEARSLLKEPIQLTQWSQTSSTSRENQYN